MGEATPELSQQVDYSEHPFNSKKGRVLIDAFCTDFSGLVKERDDCIERQREADEDMVEDFQGQIAPRLKDKKGRDFNPANTKRRLEDDIVGPIKEGRWKRKWEPLIGEQREMSQKEYEELKGRLVSEGLDPADRMNALEVLLGYADRFKHTAQLVLDDIQEEEGGASEYLEEARGMAGNLEKMQESYANMSEYQDINAAVRAANDFVDVLESWKSGTEERLTNLSHTTATSFNSLEDPFFKLKTIFDDEAQASKEPKTS